VLNIAPYLSVLAAHDGQMLSALDLSIQFECSGRELKSRNLQHKVAANSSLKNNYNKV
jgi:hypothetical protein